MKIEMKVLLTAAVIGAFSLSGCASTMQYGDAGSAKPLTTEFGSSDLQQIAEAMVDSMITFPPMVEMTASRRPVVSVDKVKNKTMQHIDTESVTDSIRTRLIRSGKFRFIDRTTDAQTIEELKTQQDSGLVDKKTAVDFGQQIGAEFLLTSNLSEIKQKAGSTTDVYYKFTMSLKNLKTGILEWSDEKEIRKVFKRGTFGG
ncbi:MAG TPA: penicillin-binding protein activator LpoB [Desulfuromonadales bacterium]|nr:penicillin-binding protein activator LpoB [Desulfuromonadales bacterium]